jgi:hypothetical protein
VETAENLYLERAPEGSKFQYILLGTPGLRLFGTFGNGPIRGLHLMGSYLYVVSGDELYRVDWQGDSENLGNINGSDLVSMEDNGSHVWVATNLGLYAADPNGVYWVTIPGGGSFPRVSYQDGYLMGVLEQTQQFWLSALDDATTINATDFTTADTLPGLCVGVISDHREPLVFKTDSIEAFYNTGDAAFPFQRTQVIERGCAAAHSITKDRNMVFWLGDDLQVYAMEGYAPRVISTPVIAALIKTEASPSSAQGYTYQDGGHTFYVLGFDGFTFVYDLDTGLWHQRLSDGIDRWRAQCHVWAAQWRKNLVGDYANGNVYELDSGTYTENGAVLRRRAVGAPVFNGGRGFIVDEFMLDIEAGVGLESGQGSDPQVVLDWSTDGGKSWSNELWRSFGKIGEFNTEASWQNLGWGRQWSPRITISDPVPVRIAGAYARIDRLSV